MSDTGAPPHPRDVFSLDEIEAPAAAFAKAMASGRLHHAWLLTGPEGVGKASFAYRAARRLLGAAEAPAFGPLGSAPEDPVSRLVAAQSHPDLMVLERLVENGKLKKSILVDDARRLPEFFAKAPSHAPFRVAIVDAADDLNLNAANAVLKTLEEPPERGVLFLVAHSPGRLLATIRSRCRRLAFAPWPQERLASFVSARLGLPEADALRMADMAKGAPGRALSLASAGALALDDQAGALLARLPDTNEAEIIALTDSFRGGEGAQRFALLLERLSERLRAATLAGVDQPGIARADLDRWAGLWESLTRLPGEVEAINLDRGDAFWSVMTDLKAAARRQPFRC
ncbi:MAG: DNA polymerase III subunit delta' [Caulobacteraceae bacterium]